MTNKKSVIILIFSGIFFSDLAEDASSRIGISGMLRFRQLYYQSESNVPDFLEGDGLKEVSVTDLLFRNRLSINVSAGINIYSVFDVYSVFGEDPGQISSSNIGFQVRNVFTEVEIFKTGKVSAGYMTFALPEGIVLATNGAGIKYEHGFLGNLLVPYFNWIKAYDNSRNVLTDGIGVSNLKDNDILIGGLKLNPSGNKVLFDFLYIFNDDNENVIDPKKNLHWAGINSTFFINNSKINFLTIYNNGEVIDSSETIQISSLLIRISYIYEKILGQNKLTFSVFLEGASGTPGTSYTSDRFMSINPSHGVTNIVVDNSAAISIIPGGDQHGLAMAGFLAGYNFRYIDIKFIYTHIRLVNNFLDPESHFGNEFDINASFDFNKNFQMNILSGIFFPEDGYGWIDSGSTEPVFEITGSVIFKY